MNEHGVWREKGFEDFRDGSYAKLAEAIPDMGITPGVVAHRKDGGQGSFRVAVTLKHAELFVLNF